MIIDNVIIQYNGKVFVKRGIILRPDVVFEMINVSLSALNASYCSFKRAEPVPGEASAHFFIYLLPTPLLRLDWPSWPKSS